MTAAAASASAAVAASAVPAAEAAKKNVNKHRPPKNIIKNQLGRPTGELNVQLLSFLPILSYQQSDKGHCVLVHCVRSDPTVMN